MDRSALFHPQADAASYRERLHASSWFGTLDAPLQDALIGIAAVRRLSAGDVLFRRGDPPDGLYCVVEGTICIGATSAEGREALLAVLEPVNLVWRNWCFRPPAAHP